MPSRGKQGNSTGARSGHRRTDTRQSSLFGEPVTEPRPTGVLNIEVEWRAALKDAIDSSGLTREQVAVEMTRLLGGEQGFKVTKAHLDAWTAPSRSPWKLPASWLPAFIDATGAGWLLDRLARKNALNVVDEETMHLANLGRTEVEIARLQGHSGTLRQRLGGAA